MKKFCFVFFIFAAISLASSVTRAPLSQKSLYDTRDVQYERGTFLIILANSYLENFLIMPLGGDFRLFKMTQGYNVDVVALDQLGLSDADAPAIKAYLQSYYESDPMLEYVLLVGDVDGNFAIPCFYIQSINEPEMDVTDYPYTFFNSDPQSEDYDVLKPKYFIGRWPVRNNSQLLTVKSKTIQYTTLEQVSASGELDYLDRALLVAGNYSNNNGQEIPPSQWPVTPVWTSFWLQDRLLDYGYTQVDTAFFYAGHEIEENPVIANAWTGGVGIIAYRGWGNSHGWHYPRFYIDDVNLLNNGWKLPVVFSLVCNTGDFGAPSLESGYGETIIFSGTYNTPRGGVAVTAPSDLDTDTRYNNVIYIGMFDALLEGRVSELGPALFTGKQELLTEFPQLSGPGDVDEFYHHVYSVVGDPSIPVWMLIPDTLYTDIDESPDLNQSFVDLQVIDSEGNPVGDVVGALLYQDELIGKGLSTPQGNLAIDFSDVPAGAALDLYLNRGGYFQKHLQLTFLEDDGSQYDPDIWTEFDILALNSITGEHYVESGASVSLALSVTNPGPYDYNGVTIEFNNTSGGNLTGEFSPVTLDIGNFSTTQTDIIFNGVVAELVTGTTVSFDAEFYQNGVLLAEANIPVLVGPVETTDPVPPCEYGYWALDNTDVEYTNAPEYDWIEINQLGTDLGLTDDTQVFDVEIGFPFTYFGQTFETLNVCSNGWTSFIPETVPYFWNFSIPGAGGASGMIAPFNDDLDDNNGTEPFNVYAYTDEENSRFILEWDSVANGEDDEFCPDCVRETFQMILLDPAVYTTESGDGEIIFQYQEIHDIDENGNYSTIGIESEDQNDGIQYLFNGILAPGAAPLTDGLAIKFTTTTPSTCQAGDVNLDGSADILDIVTIVSAIVDESITLTDDQICAADMNHDGAVDILDIVTLVSQIMAGNL
ncbi:MAG: hypothetical protein GXO91_00895 [FCB group bacterium]|nr:hypothetical protein [FCB group bacterium]